MDRQYPGIPLPPLPQIGQRYSASTMDVPAEYQSAVLLVVGIALRNTEMYVLAQLPWDQYVPMGVWFQQDYFMKNFRKEPDATGEEND